VIAVYIRGYPFPSTAAFTGMPGGLNRQVYELSDILWSVVVVDAEAAKLLLDLADLDRIIRVCGVEGIDGRCDFLDHRPPSFSALPGEVDDYVCHRSEVLNRRGHRASTESMVRATSWPLSANSL